MDQNAIYCAGLHEWGMDLLRSIEGASDVRICKDLLQKYQPAADYADDIYAWLTCALALQSSARGNFGVGCVLVNQTGDVVSWGHNQVFVPHFRSDRHAEMVVMNLFEESCANRENPSDCRLFTSLESCPMCLARLITSGIGTILHVAPDDVGGMVHKMKELPPVWIDLAARQIFDQARCSAQLVELADRIFMLNARRLDAMLNQRLMGKTHQDTE